MKKKIKFHSTMTHTLTLDSPNLRAIYSFERNLFFAAPNLCRRTSDRQHAVPILPMVPAHPNLLTHHSVHAPIHKWNWTFQFYFVSPQEVLTWFNLIERQLCQIALCAHTPVWSAHLAIRTAHNRTACDNNRRECEFVISLENLCAFVCHCDVFRHK